MGKRSSRTFKQVIGYMVHRSGSRGFLNGHARGVGSNWRNGLIHTERRDMEQRGVEDRNAKAWCCQSLCWTKIAVCGLEAIVVKSTNCRKGTGAKPWQYVREEHKPTKSKVYTSGWGTSDCMRSSVIKEKNGSYERYSVVRTTARFCDRQGCKKCRQQD